jgi:hypothetical protein
LERESMVSVTSGFSRTRAASEVVVPHHCGRRWRRSRNSHGLAEMSSRMRERAEESELQVRLQ